MTPAAWSTLIASVSLAGLQPRVELRYADSPWGPVVAITRYVPAIEPTPPGLVEVNVVYPLPLAVDPDGAARWLLFHVQQNLAHEVAEFFRVNGKRIFDPHRPQGTGPWSGCEQRGGAR